MGTRYACGKHVDQRRDVRAARAGTGIPECPYKASQGSKTSLKPLNMCSNERAKLMYTSGINQFCLGFSFMYQVSVNTIQKNMITKKKGFGTYSHNML